MYLAKFPTSDYYVVTNEWLPSIDEAEKHLGRLVGYAHGNELELPNGYEKYGNPVIFIESYNYEFENNRFRCEVWLPIRNKSEN